jgi:hypothetical protein
LRIIFRGIINLGLALLATLASAAPTLSQGSGKSQLKVIHLSPDASDV